MSGQKGLPVYNQFNLFAAENIGFENSSPQKCIWHYNDKCWCYRTVIVKIRAIDTQMPLLVFCRKSIW
jgi:hypothetical protein